MPALHGWFENSKLSLWGLFCDHTQGHGNKPEHTGIALERRGYGIQVVDNRTHGLVQPVHRGFYVHYVV